MLSIRTPRLLRTCIRTLIDTLLTAEAVILGIDILALLLIVATDGVPHP